MNNTKFCVSKDFFIIVLIGLIALGTILFSYKLSNTNTNYQSKASKVQVPAGCATLPICKGDNLKGAGIATKCNIDCGIEMINAEGWNYRITYTSKCYHEQWNEMFCATVNAKEDLTKPAWSDNLPNKLVDTVNMTYDKLPARLAFKTILPKNSEKKFLIWSNGSYTDDANAVCKTKYPGTQIAYLDRVYENGEKFYVKCFEAIDLGIQSVNSFKNSCKDVQTFFNDLVTIESSVIESPDTCLGKYPDRPEYQVGYCVEKNPEYDPVTNIFSKGEFKCMTTKP